MYPKALFTQPRSVSTNRNWYLARTVTVTGVDDLVVDGDIPFSILTAPAMSTDPLYSGMDASDVLVTNLDDDTAGITVTPTSGLVVNEMSGTDTFSVVLGTQPSAEVSIGLASLDTSEGTLSPASLTFTTENWYTPQDVTVTGVDDVDIDGNTFFVIETAAAVSDDSAYSGFDADDVEVVNLDDDGPAIYVTPTSALEVTEAGGTDNFNVVLNTLPVDDVTITLTSTDPTEGTVLPAFLVFTSENGDTPQTVTVTGADDFIADGDIAFSIVTASAVSTDPDYDGMNAGDVSVTNLDDDIAGVTVTPISGLIVNELGTTDTFTVVLETQPSADVTIAITSSDTTEGTVLPVS